MIQRWYLLGDKFHVLLLLPVVQLLNYINKASEKENRKRDSILSVYD
jgi:hypothetical protein